MSGTHTSLDLTRWKYSRMRFAKKSWAEERFSPSLGPPSFRVGSHEGGTLVGRVFLMLRAGSPLFKRANSCSRQLQRSVHGLA